MLVIKAIETAMATLLNGKLLWLVVCLMDNSKFAFARSAYHDIFPRYCQHLLEQNFVCIILTLDILVSLNQLCLAQIVVIFLAATKQLCEWSFPSVCLSVCPSVCLSVCHTFLTMFPSSYHHEIFRSYYQWQKWRPCKRSRSEVKGQGHRDQHPT